MAPFGVSKILEVKDVKEIRQMAYLEKGRYNTKPSSRMKQYCIVGNDDTVTLYHLGKKQMRKFMTLDSPAIGVYWDSTNQ